VPAATPAVSAVILVSVPVPIAIAVAIAVAFKAVVPLFKPTAAPAVRRLTSAAPQRAVSAANAPAILPAACQPRSAASKS